RFIEVFMSELQAALLMIGFGVIVAVYVFGWWQQRRYRRKFGAAFKASHADALCQESGAKLAGQGQQSASARMADEAIGEAIITDVEIAEVSAVELSVTNLLDDSCSLLNVRSDFIIELHLAEPSPAAVLDGLWQRKFDFRKPVQVCGLTLVTKKWERAIAESQVLYARFRIALQLVDRGGATSAAKLADFRHHTLETFSTAGITLLLDVPRVENPGNQFDQMIHVARELAKELQVNVVDDHRVALSDNSLAR